MRKVRVWDLPNPEKWFQGDITQGRSRPELSIGSQGQGLSESPPSLHLHARIDQMYVTWGGTFPEKKIPQSKLTARGRQDCVNRDDSDHVGQRDPCGRGTRPRKQPSVQLTPLPRQGGRPSGPGSPTLGTCPLYPGAPPPAPPSPHHRGLLGPRLQLRERWLCVALVLHMNHKGN